MCQFFLHATQMTTCSSIMILLWHFAPAAFSALLTSFTGIKQRIAADWGAFGGLRRHLWEGCFYGWDLRILSATIKTTFVSRHMLPTRLGRGLFVCRAPVLSTAGWFSLPDHYTPLVLTLCMMNRWRRRRESRALSDVRDSICEISNDAHQSVCACRTPSVKSSLCGGAL